MWETNISAGCVTMLALLVSGFAMIALGGIAGSTTLGQLGIGVLGLGLALMVMRDNQRTRRMLRRPGEHVGPVQSVPTERS